MMILSALSPRSVSIAIMLAGSAVPDVTMAQSSSPKPTVDSMIDDILKNKQRPLQGSAAPPAAQSTAAPAQGPAAGAVTAAEMQALRTKIVPCWTSGPKPSSRVAIRVEVAPDRTPVKADIVDKARYDRDPDFRAAADVAHRAIMNPRCQPWPLSPEKYSSWRVITFNFDSRDY